MGHLNGEIKVDPPAFIDEETTRWTENRVGLIPKRCSITNRWLLPFTLHASRILIHASMAGLYSKRFYAEYREAIIKNIKMVE